MSRRAALASLAALMGSACTQIEFLAANVPAAIGPYKRKANIAYGKDPQHRLDVYIPGKPGTAPPPLVVFWHGGRWSYGDKTDYLFVGAALAQLGYVAVLPNYRHYPQVKMAGFMDDAASRPIRRRWRPRWRASHSSGQSDWREMAPGRSPPA